MDLFEIYLTRDQPTYETARKIYLNTNSMTVRHIMENVLVHLLRKGVEPCHRN